MQLRSVNNGLFSRYSVPSALLGPKYTGLNVPRYRSPPIVQQPATILGKKVRGAPVRVMTGNYLGDASVNPFTGGDTGVSDPLPSDGFNWASLLTGALQTVTAVTGALHPATVPRAPVPVAGPSPVLVAAGVGALGLAAFFLLSGKRR